MYMTKKAGRLIIIYSLAAARSAGDSPYVIGGVVSGDGGVELV